MQITQNTANNPESIVCYLIPKEYFPEHPHKNLPEFCHFIGEEQCYLVEICSKKCLIREWRVKESNIDVAQWVYLVIRGSKRKYPIQIIQQTVKQPLAATLRELDQRLPKTDAVSLALHYHSLKLLVDLTHRLHCNQGSFFAFGSEGVNEQLDYPGSLFFLTKAGGVFEDYFKSQSRNFFILVPHCLVYALLEVQFDEL